MASVLFFLPFNNDLQARRVSSYAVHTLQTDRPVHVRLYVIGDGAERVPVPMGAGVGGDEPYAEVVI